MRDRDQAILKHLENTVGGEKCQKVHQSIPAFLKTSTIAYHCTLGEFMKVIGTEECLDF